MADRLLAHGLVRAERNHDIERHQGSADLVENAFEKNAQRAWPGRVRDDQEDSFSAIFGGRTSFVNHLEHLLASEVRTSRASPGDGLVGHRCPLDETDAT